MSPQGLAAGVDAYFGVMLMNPAYAIPGASVVAAWMDATHGGLDGDLAAGRVELHRDGYPLLYRVRGAEVRWLRIYADGRPSCDRLAAHLEVVVGLADAGAAVVRPVPGRNGALVHGLDVGNERRYAVLFSDAPGGALRRADLHAVSAFGAAVATIHRVGHGVDTDRLASIDDVALAFGPLAALTRVPAARPVLDELQALAAELGRRLPPELPRGLCHGDVHLGNAHVDDDGRVTIFDFDELARGPLSYDLACYWRKALLDNPDRHDADREWHAFLDGYEAVRPISADERRAIPVLATLRAIWTMALPARYTGIWGETWLDEPSYFAEHREMIRRLAAEVR